MLKLSLLLFLLLKISVVVSKLDVDAIEEFIKRRCSKNDSSNALSELTDALTRFNVCIEEATPTGTNETEIYKVLCTASPYNCFEDMLDKLESCFEPEESYLSDFILSSFNLTVELYCQDGGKLFREQRSKFKNMNCSTINNMGFIGLRKCSSNLKMGEILTRPDFVLTEADLCSDLKSMENCFLNIFIDEYKSDIYSENIKTFFKPAFTWCSRQKLGEN